MTNNSKITVELLEENHPIKPFDCEDEDIDLLEYAEMNTPSQYIYLHHNILIVLLILEMIIMVVMVIFIRLR